jgi:hypothetical protein
MQESRIVKVLLCRHGLTNSAASIGNLYWTYLVGKYFHGSCALLTTFTDKKGVFHPILEHAIRSQCY